MNGPAARAPLAHLGPQWYAPVMGWAGLALAWHRAEPLFGPAAAKVSGATGVVAAAVFIGVTIASMLRLARHRQALVEDLGHPVRHAFVAAFPISILLLATLAVAFGGPQPAAAGLWLLGLVLQFGCTSWVLSRVLMRGVAWPAMTPVMFIPIVGNVVVPLGGAALGRSDVSWLFFGIGAFLWPVFLTLVLARTAQSPLPDRLLPAWFVPVAPPAVIGLSLIALGHPGPPALAMFGIAVLFLAIALLMLPRIAAQPFGMPWWAMSFPLAAVSTLGLRLADVNPAFRLPAQALLALTSVVVLYLTLSTVRGLRAGTLLVPETIAITPVRGDAVAGPKGIA